MWWAVASSAVLRVNYWCLEFGVPAACAPDFKHCGLLFVTSQCDIGISDSFCCASKKSKTAVEGESGVSLPRTMFARKHYTANNWTDELFTMVQNKAQVGIHNKIHTPIYILYIYICIYIYIYYVCIERKSARICVLVLGDFWSRTYRIWTGTVPE